MLYPPIQAFPKFGSNMPVIIEISVVLPAPLGPRSPKVYFFLNFEVEASNGWIHTIVSLFSVEFS